MTMPWDDGLEEDPTPYPIIYFISAVGKPRHPVKIGRSNTQVASRRLKTLQTGMPHELEFLMLCEVGPEAELMTHRAFADLRIRGEWFRRGKALTDFIASLVEADPNWRSLLLPRMRWREGFDPSPNT